MYIFLWEVWKSENWTQNWTWKLDLKLEVIFEVFKWNRAGTGLSEAREAGRAPPTGGKSEAMEGIWSSLSVSSTILNIYCMWPKEYYLCVDIFVTWSVTWSWKLEVVLSKLWYAIEWPHCLIPLFWHHCLITLNGAKKVEDIHLSTDLTSLSLLF
jgi:hypothetical protein